MGGVGWAGGGVRAAQAVDAFLATLNPKDYTLNSLNPKPETRTKPQASNRTQTLYGLIAEVADCDFG